MKFLSCSPSRAQQAQIPRLSMWTCGHCGTTGTAPPCVNSLVHTPTRCSRPSPASCVARMPAKAGTLAPRGRHCGLTRTHVICPFRNYCEVDFIMNFFSLSIFRVRLVERGSPHSLPLMESGKVVEAGVGNAGIVLLVNRIPPGEWDWPLKSPAV